MDINVVSSSVCCFLLMFLNKTYCVSKMTIKLARQCNVEYILCKNNSGDIKIVLTKIKGPDSRGIDQSGIVRTN